MRRYHHGMPSPVGQRDVSNDVRIIRLLFYPIVVGIALGLMTGGGLVRGLFIAAGLGGLSLGFHALFAGAATSAVAGAVLPNNRGGAGVGYSHIEALEASGDIAGALAAWEQVIADSPDAIGARVGAADLYARAGQNPGRAAQLFRELQRHEKTPDETRRYAAQRLIDLLLGPLNNQGLALVEMRKLAERWPGTREAEGARRAIAHIKNQ